MPCYSRQKHFDRKDKTMDKNETTTMQNPVALNSDCNNSLDDFSFRRERIRAIELALCNQKNKADKIASGAVGENGKRLVITVNSASKRYGISADRIYRAINDGRICNISGERIKIFYIDEFLKCFNVKPNAKESQKANDISPIT